METILRIASGLHDPVERDRESVENGFLELIGYIVENKYAIINDEPRRRSQGPRITDTDPLGRGDRVVFRGRRRSKRRKVLLTHRTVIDRLLELSLRDWQNFVLENGVPFENIGLLETMIRICASRKYDDAQTNIRFLNSTGTFVIDMYDDDSESDSGFDSDDSDSSDPFRYSPTERYETCFEALVRNISPRMAETLSPFVLDEVRVRSSTILFGDSPISFIRGISMADPAVREAYVGDIKTILEQKLIVTVNEVPMAFRWTSFLHNLAHESDTKFVVDEIAKFIDPRRLLVPGRTYGNVSPLWVSLVSARKHVFSMFLDRLRDFLVPELCGVFESKFFVLFNSMPRASVISFFAEELERVKGLSVLDAREYSQQDPRVLRNPFPVAAGLGEFCKDVIVRALELSIDIEVSAVNPKRLRLREITGRETAVNSRMYLPNLSEVSEKTLLDLRDEQSKLSLLTESLNYLGDMLVYDPAVASATYDPRSKTKTLGTYIVARKFDSAEDIEDARYPDGSQGSMFSYIPYFCGTGYPRIGIKDMDFVLDFVGRAYFRGYPKIHEKFVSDPYNFAADIVLE